ncbi:hypothetical protein KJ761_00300 [Patescibacteria group bacterium]|nr:hypothetical protein [Patescibacteria group bacterium]
MKKADIDRIMKSIRGGRIGSLPNVLASAFRNYRSSNLEKALLELLEHPASYSARLSAYCALSKSRKKISPLALKKLEKFKKKPRSKSVIETAREQFNILP